MKRSLVSLVAATLLGSAVLATATTAEAIERGWDPYYGYAPYAPEYAYGPGYGNAYAPGPNYGYAPGSNYKYAPSYSIER
jgi:hypothetical protein